MKIILDILISFILGIIFFFIIEFFYFKFIESKTQMQPIFTDDISTNKITLIRDYEQILKSKLDKNIGFLIHYNEVNTEILNKNWSWIEIQALLESLEERDYAMTIEILSSVIILSKQIFINKNSNVQTITTFIETHLAHSYTNNQNRFFIRIYFTSLSKTEFYSSNR